MAGQAEHTQVRIERVDVRETTAPALVRAEVVVAGGRGLRHREQMGLIQALADALGGTVGVSLPLVDLGWAPRALQVGQTGTVIAPRLYIACGISGQVQHRVGIEGADVIVAINTARDAPTMKVCDLAVVSDLATVLPKLTEAVIQTRDRGPTG